MVAITVATQVTIRTGAQGVKGPPGTAALHAPTHSAGGTDIITVEDLATDGTIGQVPASDGAGGLTMVNPAGGGNVTSPGGETVGNISTFSSSNNIIDSGTSIVTVTSHIGDMANPHTVTAGQVGAEPAGSVATHTADVNAHHNEVHDLASHSDVATTGPQLDGHIADVTTNPHAVTAVQAGADPTGTAAAAVSAHNTDTDAHANLPVEKLTTAGTPGQVPVSDGAGNLVMTTPAGAGNVTSPGGETAGRITKFTSANNIDETATTETELATAVTHSTTVTGNPHSVDAADVGAEPAGAIATHAALPNAHHAEVHTILSHDTDTTGAELTSLADGSDVDLLHAHAIADAHIADVTTNPHAVTAVQAGAEPEGSIATHTALSDAHHPQVHTIVSHDTSATGANLTTMTDGSDADALHIHAIADAHIADVTGNPHAVTAAQTGAATLTPTPADDEIILGDGTATNVRGGELRWNEVGAGGVVGSPDGLVEDDGGGNVRINAHTQVFKATASLTAKLKRASVPLISAIAIPLDSVRWVGVDYNGGTPISIVATSIAGFDLLTQRPLAVVSRDSTGVYPVALTLPLTEFPTRDFVRLIDTDPLRHDSGLIIDTSGASDDKFAMTAGGLYVAYLKKSYAAIDTNTAGTVDVYTGSTANGFTSQTGLTDYPPDQYNDGTTTPATLTNNRWGNIWWYLDIASGTVAGFLGTSNTNDIATAGAEKIPNDLPPRLSGGMLLGRFLIQKDTPAETVAESAFETSFQGEGVTAHGSLSGLTPGDGGHTALQLRSEKGGVSGYASLDASQIVVEPAQVLRTTTGPTSLTIGAVADGEVLTRSGVTIIGSTPGGASQPLPIGFLRRSTTPTITTTQNYFNFDVVVQAIDTEFFTYSGGIYTAAKSFKCRVDLFNAFSVDFSQATVVGDIVVNDVTLIGTTRGTADSFDVPNLSWGCMGVFDFVATDTLKAYLYTTSGDAQVLANSLTLCVTPMETDP